MLICHDFEVQVWIEPPAELVNSNQNLCVQPFCSSEPAKLRRESQILCICVNIETCTERGEDTGAF